MRVPAVKTATPADEASSSWHCCPGVCSRSGRALVLARLAHQYLSSMPRFTMAFGGGAFARQSALCPEDFGGAALWLPPNVHPEEGDPRRGSLRRRLPVRPAVNC